jgi:hypothetical protein
MLAPSRRTDSVPIRLGSFTTRTRATLSLSITWLLPGFTIRRRQVRKSQGITNLFPHANVAPTLANAGANYQYPARQEVDPYHWDSRFDFRISSKDSVFVAWSQYNGIPNNTGGLVPNLSTPSNVSDKSHVVTVDEAHVFNSNWTNEFIFAIGSGALLTLSPSELSYTNGSSNPFNSIFQNTGTGSGGNTGILGLNIFNYGQLFTQPTVGMTNTFSLPITRGNSPTT